MPSDKLRKIIHIDMDCFYAAIEIRDNPALAHQPVAVGGSADARGVLCTCNYIARKFNVRSAMSTAFAKRLCPDLIVLPVNMHKYQEASSIIHKIFLEFTPLVEPLSLDEAYLDVSDTALHQGSATLMANAIREKIWNATQLTASAGVSTNKLLAKIASGWNKPNGLFVIRPEHIPSFMRTLPVNELFGVGKVTAQKLYDLGLKSCTDLQARSIEELTLHFGEKAGQRLYQQARGIDNRPVEPNRLRKSLSVEQTFKQDILLNEECLPILRELYNVFILRLKKYEEENRPIKNQCIKLKLSNFKVITLERSSTNIDFSLYEKILIELMSRSYEKIRLIGLGVHFANSG